VMGAHGAAGLRRAHVETIDRLALLVAQISANGNLPAIPPDRLYVTVRAVLGPMRAALEERAAILESPGFEKELVRLAWLIMGIRA